MLFNKTLEVPTSSDHWLYEPQWTSMWEFALLEKITRNYSMSSLRVSLVKEEKRGPSFPFLVLPCWMGWTAQSYPWSKSAASSTLDPITLQCIYQTTPCSYQDYCHHLPIWCPCSYSPCLWQASLYTIIYMVIFNSFSHITPVLKALKDCQYTESKRLMNKNVCVIMAYQTLCDLSPFCHSGLSLPSSSLYIHNYGPLASLSSLNHAWHVSTSGAWYMLWFPSTSRIFLHQCA